MKTSNYGCGMSPAYEAPDLELLMAESQSVICTSGYTDDFIDNGDVEWF